MSGALLGVGASVAIDLWAAVLRAAFGVRSLDYCLLGRWVSHFAHGQVLHANIGEASPKTMECPVGWAMHFSIGAAFGALFILLAPREWLSRPTLGPALAFGIATVLVPMLTLQPAFGLGIASSKTPHPNRARAKSVATHAIFGPGLYLLAALHRLASAP